MSLFKKKEKTEQPNCCCEASNLKQSPAPSQAASECYGEATESICCVKVLGSGCASCHALYENTCKAVKDVGFDIEVEYVTDMEKIMGYKEKPRPFKIMETGVMSMPALVVNEKVVSVGKVLKPQGIKKLLAPGR